MTLFWWILGVCQGGVTDLLGQIEAHDPAVAVADGYVTEAEAEVVAARIRPNPELAWLGMGRFRGDNAAINGAQHQPQVNWAIPLGGRLIRGVQAAKTGVSAREAERAVTLDDRLTEGAAGWFELLWARSEAELQTEVVAILRELADRAERRAEGGGEARFDAGRLRLAAERAESDRLAFSGVPLAVAARLEALVGGALPVVDLAELSSLLPAPTGQAEVALATAARARQDEAAAGVRAAKTAVVPIPEVSGGLYLTRDGDSASWVAGVSVPLPIFDRGQGEVARAKAKVAVADAEARLVSAELTARQQAARSRVEAARGALSAIDAAIASVPPDGLRSAARVAWAEGRFSVLELLDAETAWAEARSQRHRALLEQRLAEIELLAAFGEVGRLRGR